MRTLFAFLLASIFTAAPAFADVQLYCDVDQGENCEVNVALGLQQMGCRIAAIQCSPNLLDGSYVEYCQVSSANCSDPTAEIFGFTADAVHCGRQTKGNLRDIPGDIFLTWTQGLFRDWVRVICIR